MTKEEFYEIVGKLFPGDYLADIKITKSIRGTGRIMKIFTIPGDKDELWWLDDWEEVGDEWEILGILYVDHFTIPETVFKTPKEFYSEVFADGYWKYNKEH